MTKTYMITVLNESAIPSSDFTADPVKFLHMDLKVRAPFIHDFFDRFSPEDRGRRSSYTGGSSSKRGSGC
jgi:hypothetical protein